MNNIDKLNLSLGLIKQASPRWARLLKSLSPESLDKLKNYFPADYARQVGKNPLGQGHEGIVYPAFVGQKGEAIVKYFDNDLSKRWNENIKQVPGFSDLNLNFIPTSERGKALQAIKNPGLLDVYKPTDTGYFAERLFKLPALRGSVYTNRQLFRNKSRLSAANRLLNRYNSAVDSYRKEHPIKGFFLNLFKNRTDKFKLLNKEIKNESRILKNFNEKDVNNFNANVKHYKQLARLYDLINPGTKPVLYRNILATKVNLENLFGKLYKDTGLIKTKGGNQAGKPFYIGDVNFNTGHNIMRRANGHYVISDPNIAVADY